MKRSVDTALDELQTDVPITRSAFFDLDLPTWRFCDGLAFVLGFLDLVREHTSNWNFVVRWVIGELIERVEKRLEELCVKP